MLTLRLPDGSTKQVPEGTRPRDVAQGIGKRLAQAAVAAKVNGTIVDLDRELTDGHGEITFQILTERDPEALEVLRHSCAHVMARAVMRLFPGVQLAFGPPIENGFYYDIDATPPLREEDFPRIEEEMRKIVAQAEPFERFERPTPEGRALCEDLAQSYKVEHIDDDLEQFPTLSFYRQGEFIDLCRGPHIPHAGKVGAFKLLSIAGAYWKNDSSRKQLQRLYGTAFFNQKDLDDYLHQVEEAKKRDHRDRLLLRHRLADPHPRGGLPAHRGGDAQDHQGGRTVRALRAARRGGPGARPGLAPELQGRTHRR